MKNAEYNGEIYNIETIYVYDEYISLYKGNLLETEPIKVALIYFHLFHVLFW